MEIIILTTEITSRGTKVATKTITTNKTEKEIQSITECLRDTWYLNFESVVKTDSKLKANILEKLLV